MSQVDHLPATRRRSLRWTRLIASALLLAAATLWAAPSANAGAPPPIVVNDFGDAKQASDGKCTLREAIIAANSDDPSGSKSGECPGGDDADTILLPPGVYTLSRSDSGNENASTTGDLDIQETVTIRSTGPGLVVIDAGAINNRVFHVLGGTAKLSGVTLRGGHAAQGGGVLVESGAALHLENSTLTGNSADGAGGAIYNAGQVKLINVTIAGNQAASARALHNTGQAEVGNTLIAANPGPVAPDCAGSLTPLGPNLVEDGDGCALGDAALVGPPGFTAQQAGGQTVFYRLLAGSAAFNAGDNAICPATDQLGVARPQFTRCDIGAHELDRLPPAATSLAVTTVENTAVTIELSGSGSEGETLAFAIAGPPGQGTLEALTQTGSN
ncbi:MAG TPA: CSLREA domain-containing protein, partial [Caldilineaceae bacterium]|nr:CSLREA domain-containing protein [Caldilineaceae bacterium]